MLMESIVAASTAATAQASARSRMRAASVSRRSGASSLLSLRARMGRSGERMAAAGPPRPEQRAAAAPTHPRHAVKAARAQLALDGGLTTDFATRRFGPHGI